MNYKILIMMLVASLQIIQASQQLDRQINYFHLETLSQIIGDKVDQAGQVLTFEDRYPELSEIYQAFGLNFKNDFIEYVHTQYPDMQEDEIFIGPNDIDGFIELAEQKIEDQAPTVDVFIEILVQAINANKTVDQIDDPLFYNVMYLDHRKSLINKYLKIDNKGDELLREASVRNNVSIVQFLLDYGADIHAVNEAGDTSLHIAAQSNADKVVQLLLQAGANASAANNIRSIPLYHAVCCNADKVFSILFQINVNPTYSKDVDFLLHYAVRCSADKIVPLLLTQGVDLNKLDSNGWTLLYLAVHGNNKKIISLLLAAGADANIPTTESGEFPLCYAVNSRHMNIVKLLLEGGADVNCQGIHNLDTPLHVAVSFFDADIVKLLLQYNPNVQITDYYGRTALDNVLNEDIKSDSSQEIIRLLNDYVDRQRAVPARDCCVVS